MFKHSVPVPRLYKSAAKIIKSVKTGGLSVKYLLYKQKSRANLKAIYALVTETIKYEDKINFILGNTELLDKETRFDPWLARVLITELLWRKKTLPGNSVPVQTILRYKKDLEDANSLLPEENPKKSSSDKVKKPRYVRVNTLKISLWDAINVFQNDGWQLVNKGFYTDYKSYLSEVASLTEEQFLIDIHIKDLLVFAPYTEFYQNQLYLNGDIILQDKASCLPPFVLNPTPGSEVLDMCASPGMKSSQTAAIVGKDGVVYAFERNGRRFNTLCKIMNDVGAENVNCIHKDALNITEDEVPNVEYILLDPSCSGSGIVGRFESDYSLASGENSRLQKLSNLQIVLLRHALTNFPKVKKVVYSTCSVHPEENEKVVMEVINSVTNFRLVPLKEIMEGNWFNFGSEEFEEIGPKCMYAKSEQDMTNGFFLALFERISSDSKTEIDTKTTDECKYESYDNSEDSTVKNKNSDRVLDPASTDVLEVKEEPLHNDEKSTKKKKKKPQKNLESSALDDTLEIKEEPFADTESIHDKSTKKKKKKRKHDIEPSVDDTVEIKDELDSAEDKKAKKKKKKKRDLEDFNDTVEIKEEPYDDIEKEGKKKKKKHENPEHVTIKEESSDDTENRESKKKNNKIQSTQQIKNHATILKTEKKKKKLQENSEHATDNNKEESRDDTENREGKKKKKRQKI